MNKTRIKVIFLIVLMVAATFLYSVEEKNDTETVIVLGDSFFDISGYFMCFCYMGSNCGCILFGGGMGPSPDMRG